MRHRQRLYRLGLLLCGETLIGICLCFVLVRMACACECERACEFTDCEAAVACKEKLKDAL